MAEHIDRDQRTEAATPRRREEARDRGQVALSAELVGALLLAAWLAVLAVGGGSLARAFGESIAGTMAALGQAGSSELSARDASTLVARAAWPAARATSLLIAPPVAIGLLASYGQIGFRFAPEAIGFDPSRIDPRRGFQRIFSLRSSVRVMAGLTKLAAIAVVVVAVAWSQIGAIARLSELELGPALAAAGHIALRCAGAAILALVAIAVADLCFQRWQHERDLRMTKQELREELRATEGDPHIKAHIRRVQRELARRRMLLDVPRAAVIITNPTHYAVALRYDRANEKDSALPAGAPRVAAKGVDRVAERIKEIGRENGVALYEDVALARALHARCEIGDEIPIELYTAVAEVLAYVYRVQSEGLA
jgi:flagellar biosynthetic protein FlhB